MLDIIVVKTLKDTYAQIFAYYINLYVNYFDFNLCYSISLATNLSEIVLMPLFQYIMLELFQYQCLTKLLAQQIQD